MSPLSGALLVSHDSGTPSSDSALDIHTIAFQSAEQCDEMSHAIQCYDKMGTLRGLLSFTSSVLGIEEAHLT